MEEITILESMPVTVNIQFCAEHEANGDTWYFTKNDSSNYSESGGSYTKEVAYARYLAIIDNLKNK